VKHTENDYIQAGYRTERAKTPSAYAAETQRIRVMLEAETIEDQREARRLIAQGIEEARK
jgi:hypothetical protein